MKMVLHWVSRPFHQTRLWVFGKSKEAKNKNKMGDEDCLSFLLSRFQVLEKWRVKILFGLVGEAMRVEGM